MGETTDVTPTLRDLAGSKFKDLTPAELTLLEAVSQGEVAECSPNPDDPNAPENDPANAESWGKPREIRAALIRWLCIDPEAGIRIDPKGICIHAARIAEELDLSFASVRFPLRFFNCSFLVQMMLARAHLRAFHLSGSRTSAIVAGGVEVDGDIFLGNGFSAEGEVFLLGADIGGDLDCTKGSFKNPGQTALSADSAKVGGSVFLSDGFSAEGEVSLPGADIGSDLDCTKGSFKNPGQVAISATGAKVKGGIFFSDGFSAEGEVSLLGADIEGDLDCGNGSFKNRDQTALSAERAKVRGGAFFNDGFSAEGEVRLHSADIGRSLDCGKGRFKNPGKVAIDAARAKVRGGVFFNDGFSAEGEVRLLDADIGGSLEVTKADLRGTKLNAQGANLKGAFLLSKVTKTNAEAQNTHTEIDLRSASVGALVDDLECWPDSGHLFLDGFVYDSIVEAPSAKGRLNWLRRSMSGRYRSQPYQQLAKVLSKQGREAESLVILVGMEDDRRRYAILPWYEQLWAWVLRKTIGYGYRPLFALGWIMFFVVIGFVIFGMGYRAGLLAPSDKDAYSRFAETRRTPPGYEPFCAAVYSFNTFVPLIDLGQRERWVPNPIPIKPLGYSGDNPLARVLCDAAIVDVLPHYMTPSTTFLRFYRWGHTLLGWFFTTMFVAGITGLVRR